MEISRNRIEFNNAIGIKKFEPGKYYKHTTGKRIHVIGHLPGSRCWYNREKGMLVAEELATFELTPIGETESATVNWVEDLPWVEAPGSRLLPAEGE